VGQLLCQSPEKGAFKDLKVADIFMGGGTTLVEGSRLGMQMVGNDLNPVAWFVVKQELANVDLEQVKSCWPTLRPRSSRRSCRTTTAMARKVRRLVDALTDQEGDARRFRPADHPS
jgi:hypothetical protein